MTAIYVKNPLSDEDRINAALAISDHALETLEKVMKSINDGRGPKPGDNMKITIHFRFA